MNNKYVQSVSHFLNGIKNKGVRNASKSLKEWDRLNLDKSISLRNKLIQEIVQYAFDNVAYYHETFIDHGIVPSQIQDYQDFSKLPVLTKDIIRNNHDKLISKQASQLKTHYRRSGGTTGEPMKILVDRDCQAFETYSLFKGYKLMGLEPGVKIFKFWGSSLVANNPGFGSRLRSKILNQTLIPAFEINGQTARLYLEQIRGAKRCVFMGYPSAMYSLALYAQEFGIELNNIDVAITTSELLQPTWIQLINQVFNCKVRSYYGCSEIEVIGYQADQEGLYNVHKHVSLVESINYHDQYEEIVASSLHNRAMPLLRYKNGDTGVVRFNDRLGHEELLQIEGRSDDFFITKTGEFVSGRLGAKLISLCNLQVERFQLIQFSIEKFEFRYKSEDALAKTDVSNLRNEIKAIFGPDTMVELNNEEPFIVSKSHKIRTSICLVPKKLPEVG